MDGTNRLPDPARLREYPLDVFRVKPGTTHSVKTVTDSYGGLFGHYKQKRTRYCPGEQCSCEHRKLPRVWYGFAACFRFDRDQKLWLPIVLQVSEALDHCFHGKYRRGQVWTLSRAEESKEKPFPPILGQLVEELKAHQVPEGFPVKPVLQRVFRTTEIALVHANPVPPPVRIVVEEAPPPRQPGEVPAARPGNYTAERIKRELADATRLPSGNGVLGKGQG
jgi:hypothetical protein